MHLCRVPVQVVAHGDGRDVVHEYDCLLLEHVFGNMPDDCHKVRANVLDTIAADPGLQQTELVFLGLFGRACRWVIQCWGVMAGPDPDCACVDIVLVLCQA